ncbi:molybdate transport system ATP-binding protein [Breoghania corrubedonensis]|uniref:Molybdate transport system ATP-binding protein n=1 Tax=Breoghania corrubedonensis TaxID=665038 RepID=A0A2T5V6P3_9HYPH|nr:molybdenum ABC transporter ATP-binding protein [Breoghania corrubedonensis]PTW59421.1 molybdate transport system ATP-binding protein [Breoghania corrubedonensis]
MLSVDIEAKLGTFHLSATFESSAGVTALFGRSGAGKTSVVHMIAGLSRPMRGRIAVDDMVLYDSDRKIDLSPRQRRIGHVFQEARLFPHLTVRRNLTFSHWAGGRTASMPFDEVVELLGIGKLLDRRPAKLSGGERQRVAIGRALLSGPRILLMDEPLASLDQARKSEILPYLDRLRREAAIPIVYVSHSLEEVARLAETLVIISDGKVEAVGPVGEVMTRLDLGPATGRQQAGAVLDGRISSYDEEWDLTHIDVEGQMIEVPAVRAEIGEEVRLHLRARDIALALEVPGGLSIRNALPVTVLEITHERGPYAEVVCALGAQRLRARITRASLVALGLKPGQPVFALVKSVAVDRPLASLDVERDNDGFMSR